MRIQTPCHESWDQMRGDGAVRHCDRCAAPVTDVDALDEAAALALIRGGPTCVRGRADAAGNLLRFVALAGAAALTAAPALEGAARAARSLVVMGARSEEVAPAIPEGPTTTPAVDPETYESLRVIGYLEE